jgi:hypothetical protein
MNETRSEKPLDVHYSRGYFEKTWGNVKMENAVAGSGYSTVICLGNIILYPLLSSQHCKLKCAIKGCRVSSIARFSILL